MNMSFLNFCGIWLIPGWSDVLSVPVPERIADCVIRRRRTQMLEWSQSPEAGVFRRLADFGDYRLGDVYAPENEELRGRGSCATSPGSAGRRTSARCSTS